MINTFGENKSMNYRNNLSEVLKSAKNEQEIQRYLKNNKILVRNAFNVWAWNHVDVISELPLGSDYRIDFVVLSADSGSWHMSIIELKSHKMEPFTKKGIQTSDLNIALTQIQDRAEWIKRYEPNVRELLSKYFRKGNIPAQCSNSSEHNLAETEIVDFRTVITYKYTIVIGRRNMISKDYQRRRFMAGTVPVNISTYDKLLDVAQRLDEPNISQ